MFPPVIRLRYAISAHDSSWVRPINASRLASSRVSDCVSVRHCRSASVSSRTSDPPWICGFTSVDKYRLEAKKLVASRLISHECDEKEPAQAADPDRLPAASGRPRPAARRVCDSVTHSTFWNCVKGSSLDITARTGGDKNKDFERTRRSVVTRS